ncbi:MAG: LytR/AlgR family response regulator transcription factor [Flammeovirgaceae bacterium]
MKVLIIEDEARLLRGVMRHVKSFGYEIVATAGSYEEVVDTSARLNDLDIAIVDIGLGGHLTGGIEAAKYLQKKFPRLAIIFLTVHNKDFYQDKALNEVVMVNYLIKPYQPAQLELALKMAMNLRNSVAQISPQKATILGFYGGREEAVKCHLIHWIELKSGTLWAYTDENTYYRLDTFSSLDRLIEAYPESFTKIHQSYAVNLGQVTQIEGDTKSARNCFVQNKLLPLPISRRLFTSVKEAWQQLHQK